MKEPKKIHIKDEPSLPLLYTQGWELICFHNEYIYLHREIPKKKQSTSLVVKTGTNTLNFLLSCFNRSENSRIWWEDNWITEDTLFEFANYWLERSENGTKYRFEKEKVFDVRRRLRTWVWKNYNKQTEKISNIVF